MTEIFGFLLWAWMGIMEPHSPLGKKSEFTLFQEELTRLHAEGDQAAIRRKITNYLNREYSRSLGRDLGEIVDHYLKGDLELDDLVHRYGFIPYVAPDMMGILDSFKAFRVEHEKL